MKYVKEKSTTLTVQGQGGIIPYTYIWDNGLTASSRTVTPTATTTYTVTVTDNNGTTSICSRTVTVHANPICTINGPSAVCANTTGHVYSGPCRHVELELEHSGNGSIPGATTGQNVTVGCREQQEAYTLTLTITDANGCMSTCDVTVTVNANPVCTINGPTAVCENTTGHVYSGPAGMA